MIAKSVLACYRSVGLVTEDASPGANKSTDHGQLPDIWKLPMAGHPLQMPLRYEPLAVNHRWSRIACAGDYVP
jgi:hypothetical protein